MNPFVPQKSVKASKVKHLGPQSSIKSVAMPMEYVGSFLESTFEDILVSIHAMVKKRLPSQQPDILHYVPGYTQDQLIVFLLELYQRRAPKSFEVFKCHSNCTKDELQYFLDRTKGISSNYTLLEVNELPFQLQEVLLLLTVCVYIRKNHKILVIFFSLIYVFAFVCMLMYLA